MHFHILGSQIAIPYLRVLGRMIELSLLLKQSHILGSQIVDLHLLGQMIASNLCLGQLHMLGSQIVKPVPEVLAFLWTEDRNKSAADALSHAWLADCRSCCCHHHFLLGGRSYQV